MRNKGHERPNSERYAAGSCAADPDPLESNRVGLFGTLRSFRLFNYRNGIYPKKLKLKFSKVRQKARESFFEIRAAAECLFRAWQGVRRAHSANGKSAAIRADSSCR